MYPINVSYLIERGTIGMNGDDPTLPEEPSRRSRLVEPLRAAVRRRSAARGRTDAV
jgi:hypothetical protein